MSILVCAVFLAVASLQAQYPASCVSGLELYNSGNLAAAQTDLWDCVESGKGNDSHAFYLAQTYRALKNNDAGLTRADGALNRHPANVDLLYITSYLHYRRNQGKDSMVLATRAYGIAPGDWRIHQLFALNYISFNMPEAARLSLDRAIRLNPDNAELHYQMARVYFNRGSFVDSIRESERALEIFPEYPEVHHNLGLCYEGNGEPEKAADSFQRAIALNAKYKRLDELPLIDFAVFQRMGGRIEAALPLLREALAISPRSARANYEMGELLRDLKRYPEAKKYLETARALNPCDAKAVYGLALVTRTLGDVPTSIELLKRFKELDAATKNPAAKPCS